MADSISDVLGSQESPFAGDPELQSASYPPFAIQSKAMVLKSLAERAAGVVPSRDFYPLLQHFLVTVTPGRMLLAATDLELSVLASTELVVTTLPPGRESVTAVLPARRLLECLRAAPEGDVLIAVDADTATVNAGDVQWTLHLRDSADYPDLPDLSQVPLEKASREGLLSGLKAVRHAVGRDAGRPQLTMVDITDGVATGCDNARLAQAPVPELSFSLQVPAAGSPAAVDELIRILASGAADEIEAGETDHSLVFNVGSYTFLCAKPTAKFPHVQKQLLAPSLSNDQVLTVMKADLLRAVRRVRINADPGTSAIGLRLGKGSLTVFSRDTKHNTAEERLEAGWDGEERVVVLNHAYLADALESYPAGEVTAMLGKDSAKRRSAVLLRDSDSGFVAVLQQMLASLVGY